MNEPRVFNIPDRIDTVMVHCLATRPDWANGCDADWIMGEVTRWHTDPKPKGRGWLGVGYAAIIDRNGNIAWGRDLDGDGDVFDETMAAAVGWNRRAVPVALDGGFGSSADDRFEDHFTPAQAQTLRWFIEQCQAGAHGRELTVKGHNEVANRACPGFQVELWLVGAQASAPAPTLTALAPDRATIRLGDRGAFVTDLQTQLHALGYPVGRMDGIFGAIVQSAVVAFQTENGLLVDGVVRPRTWDALRIARPRPERDVTGDDLRAAGSRTIRDGDTAQTAIGLLTGGGTVLAAVDQADDVVGALEGARGVAGRAIAILSESWPVLLLIVGGVVVFALIQRMKAARVEDARTGKNLGR